jgi:hypothetical protein
VAEDSAGSLIWNTSPSVYNSLKQSNADEMTMRRSAAAMKLLSQHNSFIEMPDIEAKRAFSRLPKDNQDALREFMDVQNYSKEDASFWQKTKLAGSNKFGGLMNAFEKYGFTQTNAYRIANLQQEQQKQDPNQKFNLFWTGDQWDTTWNGEQYFDKNKADEVTSKYSPAVAKVAKLYAMRKPNQEIIALLQTAEEEQAFMAFNDPKNGKKSEVAKAINEFDQAKVSPGRDLAYNLRKYDKASKVPDVYDVVSGLTDLTFTTLTDPLILASKAGALIRATKFGLLNLAGKDGIALSTSLDKMFKARSVRNYWDDAGAQLDKFDKSKNLSERAQIAAVLGKDFGLDTVKVNADDASELVAKDIVQHLADAGVRDADTALSYFKNAGITELISMGKRAGELEPLMPRKTVLSTAGKTLRNATGALLGLKSAPDLPAIWDETKVLSQNFGKEEDLKQYRSVAGNLNRIITKAASGNPIDLDSAASSADIFSIARLVVDPFHANIIKQAWREGDVGSRLQLFDGLMINVGKKFGLSEEAVKKLYNRTGTQLYAEDMTVLSKTGSGLNQLGRRTGLVEKTLSSTAALSRGALADLNRQLKDAKVARKELQQKIKELEAKNVPFAETDPLKKELENLNKKIGGIVNKTKTYKKATGDDIAGEIRKAMLRAGITLEDTNAYTDILRKGAAGEGDPYQFQQIVGTVYDVVSRDDKLAKALSKNDEGFEVVDFDLVEEYVQKAFPSTAEVAQRLGQGAYNPAQLGDAQYALGYWQLSNKVATPNFAEWSRAANGKFLGSYSGQTRWLLEKVTDGWSWFTLIPRLGIRSAIEELGLFGITVPFGDLHRILIGKKISNEYRYAAYGEQALGFINRNIARLLRTGDSRITPAQRKLIQDDPSQLPAIVAKNVARSKAVMILSGFNTKDVERWVNDWFEQPFGFATLDEINEGALGALNVGETAADKLAFKSQKIFGPLVQHNYRAEDAAKDLRFTGEFNSLRYKDYGFDNAWLAQIQLRLDPKTNLGWGKTVLAHIYNEEKAVKSLVKQFESNPEIMNKFVLYKELGAEEFARRQYKFITHPFTKSNGLLNDKLIAKVRKSVIDPTTGKSKLQIDASNLTLRDLDEFGKLDTPETVLGKVYMPMTNFSKLGQWVSGGQARLMNVMSKQIAILGREPALFANYQIYRKRLIQAESDIAKRHMDNGMDKEAAERLASKWAANIAGDLSLTRTLQYLDNPAMRTNLAFNIRNIARYYRATEDFYRRTARVVRYDPLAIAKFRLTTQGLEHTGFIHTDENGELYFVYPGDEIIYTAVGLGLRLTGHENYLRQVQPAQFTAKVSMLTPSLDPDSAIPTLSGPVSAFAIAVVENFLPDSQQMEFRKTVLGKYSVNRTLPELLLPVTVGRVLNTLNSDEKTSQFASAVRKAHLYYAANGIMKKFIAEAEKGGATRAAAIATYNAYVNATARNIVVTRNLIGLFAPASPTADFGLDVPDWIREQTDVTTLKPEFQKLVKQYGDDPNAYDKALAKYTKLYPGKAVYALTESEKTGVGSIGAYKEAQDWIKDNPKLMKSYPEGVRFIIPSNGQYDLETYAFLEDQGLTEKKDIQKFAAEAVVYEDLFYWRQVKKISDDELVNATDAGTKRAIRNRWEAWSSQYRAQHPQVQVYLDNVVRNDQLKKDAVRELYDMNQKKEMPMTDSNKKIMAMVNLYYEFNSKVKAVSGQTDGEVAFRKALRKQALDLMLQYAGYDDQALAAYRTLFDPLIGE